MQIKTVIFDFDGTIADTLSAGIKVINKNAQDWGFRQIKQDELEHLRGMTPFELLKEFKIPFYRVPFLVKKFQLELFDSMNRVKVYPGMKTVIETLHKKGIFLGIVTSNTEKNVLRCLEANSITSFDFIHDEKNIFGKARVIESMIKKYGLVKDEAVYVGDEVRDIEAARKSSINSISVSWGFNTKKLLQKHSAKQIVDTPQELLSAITKQTQ